MKINKNKSLLALLILGTSPLFFAQETDRKPLKNLWLCRSLLSIRFPNPTNNTRPSFIYSHNRNNEVNLNLGLIKANYETEQFRANLALAAGTYMNANYAAEPGVLKNAMKLMWELKFQKVKIFG